MNARETVEAYLKACLTEVDLAECMGYLTENIRWSDSTYKVFKESRQEYYEHLKKIVEKRSVPVYYELKDWKEVALGKDTLLTTAILKLRTEEFGQIEAVYHYMVILVKQKNKWCIAVMEKTLVNSHFSEKGKPLDVDTALRQEQAKYEALIHSLPGGFGMYEIHPSGIQCLSISDSVYDLCERSREEYLEETSNNPLSIVYEPDLPGLMDAIEKATIHKSRLEHIFRIRLKDDGRKWIHCSGVLVPEYSNYPVFSVVMADVDSSIRNKAKLQKAESILSIAVENSDINFWSYDPIAKRLFHTESSKRMHGSEVPILENFPEILIAEGLIRPDSIEDFRAMHHAIRHGAKKVSRDIWIKKANNSGWWCEHICYTSTFNTGGVPTMAYALGRDITAQKVAEQQYDDERIYRQIVTENLLVSIRMDVTQGCIEDIQDNNFYRLPWQDSIDERVIFRKIEAQIPDEQERKAFKKHFYSKYLRMAFERGETQKNIEIRMQQEDGLQWVRVSVTTRAHPVTGHIMGFITFEDIQQEKLLVKILEKVTAANFDYVCYLNVFQDEAVTFATSEKGNPLPPIYTSNFNINNQAYIEKNAVPEDKIRCMKDLDTENLVRLIQRDGEMKGYYDLAKADGSVRKKFIHVFALDGDTRNIVLTRADVTDIFEEKQRQNQLLNDALVAAEQANTAKTEFLSRMSREIRTPMNAIIGLTVLAAQTPESSENVIDALNKIGISARFLLVLINDILDMSRIESGKMIFTEERINMKIFIEHINEIIRRNAEETGITFVSEIAKDVAACYLGDASKLQQILLNILGNAVKFTPRGGEIRFMIRAVEKNENMTWLHFIISDNGVGITKNFIPNLFEAFRQEEIGTTATYPGTGLGLTISKSMVKMMGGDIDVVSEKGKGSTFTVKLCLKSGDVLSENIQIHKDFSGEVEGNGLEPEYDFTGYRVLLVEDHPLNTEVAKRLLELKGMVVDTAENGQQAVEAFFTSADGHYNLILMDVRMPIMDGLTATANIRQLPKSDSRSIPIIAMTANTFSEDIKAAKAHGMDAHLAKPIEPNTLYRTIAYFLTQKH